MKRIQKMGKWYDSCEPIYELPIVISIVAYSKNDIPSTAKRQPNIFKKTDYLTYQKNISTQQIKKTITQHLHGIYIAKKKPPKQIPL